MGGVLRPAHDRDPIDKFAQRRQNAADPVDIAGQAERLQFGFHEQGWVDFPVLA